MRVFWIFPRRWYYFGNLFLLKNLLFTNFKGNEKKKMDRTTIDKHEKNILPKERTN
jgi:hypothetical protein